MDLSLGSAVVVAGAVVGNTLPARASNLLQLPEDGPCRLWELTAGDTVVSVGLLEVLVVIGFGQSLDEGQVACHDIGRGGSDDAGEGDGEKLHFLLIFFGGRWFVLCEKSQELGCCGMMKVARKGPCIFILFFATWNVPLDGIFLMEADALGL